MATLIYPILKNFKYLNPPPRYLFWGALIPISIDLSLTIFQIWQNIFFTRFATGLLLGAVVALFVIPGILKLREENYGVKT